MQTLIEKATELERMHERATYSLNGFEDQKNIEMVGIRDYQALTANPSSVKEIKKSAKEIRDELTYLGIDLIVDDQLASYTSITEFSPDVETDIAILREAEELKDVSENIRQMMQKTVEATGIDVSTATIVDLPDSTAGQYTLSDDKISFNPMILKDDDAVHAAIHESHHKNNKKKARTQKEFELIENVKLEEALTELATSNTTGEVIAYKQEIPLVDQIAAQASRVRNQIITKADLVELFKQGKNSEINAIYDLAA